MQLNFANLCKFEISSITKSLDAFKLVLNNADKITSNCKNRQDMLSQLISLLLLNESLQSVEVQLANNDGQQLFLAPPPIVVPTVPLHYFSFTLQDIKLKI